MTLERRVDAFAAGTLVGRFCVQGVIGRGGQGVVYRAVDASSGAGVALKVVLGGGPEALASFRREARALARLRHQGIVPVLADGVHDGRPWYAMDLVSGTTLRDLHGELAARHSASAPTTPLVAGRVRDDVEAPELGPLSREHLLRMLGIVARLCETLAYVHGEGIVHRDLKPENVLLDASAYPRLVDFGLVARFSGSALRESVEITEGAGGTLAYIAPEQARGEPVDARADLYSLGCILYEIATGRPPFVGAMGRVLAAHQEEAPCPPADLVRDLPEGLDGLVLRLLEKEPRHRLGHALDVARVLVQIGADVRSVAGPVDGSAESAAPRAYLYRSELAGRESEMRILRARVAELGRGRGGLVALTGESGAGKTRLATEVAREAQLLATVVSAACTAGAALPLEPLRPALLALADRLPAARRVDVLSETERAVLSVFEPALASSRAAIAAPELAPGPARRRIVVSVLRALTALAAERPLLLVLDDVQWADPLTLEVLHELAQWEPPRVLALVTIRAEEALPSTGGLLGGPGALTVSVGRLPEDVLREIVKDMLAVADPAPELVSQVVGGAEGNPLFVAAFLHAAVDQGLLERSPDSGTWRVRQSGTSLGPLDLPVTIADALGRRLALLSPDARRVAQTSALLAGDAPVELLQAASGLSDDAWVSSLHELVVRRVLEDGAAGHLRLAHGRLRHVAAAAIDPGDLPGRHGAIAQAMSGDERWEVVAQRARHWEAAGDAGRAFLDWQRTAEEAAAHFANELAAEAYGKVVAAAPDAAASARARVKRADLLMALGRVDDADAEAEALLQVADGLGPGVLVDALLTRSHVRRAAGNVAESLAANDRALAVARATGDRAMIGQTLASTAAVLADVGETERGIALMRECLEIQRELGARRFEGMVLSNIGTLLAQKGQIDLARHAYEEALAIAREVDDPAQIGRMIGGLGLLLTRSGNIEESLPLYMEALAAARARGDAGEEGILLANIARTHRLQGDPGRAARDLDESREAFRRSGVRGFLGANAADRGVLEEDEGNLEAAEVLHAEALSILRETGMGRLAGPALLGLARVALARGRLDEARSRIEEAWAHADAIGDTESAVEARLLLAREARLSGDTPRAAGALGGAEELLSGGSIGLLAVSTACERVRQAVARGEDAGPALARARAALETLHGVSRRLPERWLALAGAAAAAASRGETVLRGERPEELSGELAAVLAARCS